MGRALRILLIAVLTVTFGTGVAAARTDGKRQAPNNTSLPKISGNPTLGSKLTGTTGSWSGSVLSYSFQWTRCNSSGGSCAAISGASSTTYLIVSADVGSTLRVVVTTRNRKGYTAATSAATAPVNGPPTSTSTTTTTGTTTTATTATTTTATTTTGTTIGTTTGTTIGTTTGTTTTTPPPPPPPVTTPLATSLPARIAEWSGTGNTYYVDASSGSDSYTEAQARNESTPWKTIQKAVNSYALPASGHVRILVKNGTYRASGDSNAVQATVTFENLGSRTPSAGSVLNLMAYPGASPVVQEPPYAGSTPGNAERHGFWFGDTSAKFIRVRGFRVTQNTAAMNQAQGFRIDSSSDIEIDQCEISGWKSAAVGNNPRAQGVYIGSGSTRVHMYNLVVHDIGNPATEATNLSHGFYIQGSHHVLANVISYDNRNGFGVQFYAGGGGGPGHIITNLVTANNKMSGMVVDGTYTASVRNSVFYDNDQWGLSVRGSANVTAENTISFANGSTGTLGNGFNTEGSSKLALQNILGVNPLFVNFGARNFHLQSGSPAYRTGAAAFTPLRDLDQSSNKAATIGSYRAPEDS